jgi:alanine racemase
VGIFTNIGDAHSEGFKDVKQKIQEKLKLFIHAEYLIYSADYTAITEVVDYMKTQSAVKYQFQSITWSKKEALRDEVDLYITTIEKGDTYTTIQGLYQDKTGAIRIPFTDDASIENAIHCWLLLLHWGYNDMVILERMMQLSPVEMRLEIKGGINGCTLISDCYNSDLNALTIALDFLEHQNQNYNRTLILSDILGAKSTAEVLYQKVADLLAEKSVNRIIGIGENIQQYGYLFDVAQKQFFTGTDEFLADFPSFQQETVLIKGARSFAFERIVQKMSQKAHNTVLEINLNAMAHNLKTYRSLLKPKTKIMAMVKAFAYGSGTFEIANLLQYNKVDYLAVAYTDEGVELRKAGVTLPIMVMNPEPSTFEAVVQYKLEPEIYSLSHLQKFEQHLKASIANPTLPFPIHLKIDTGMHRLGFDENDVNRLIKRLKTSAYFKIKSVFSHLAAADDAKHDEFTSQQLIRFNLIYKEISKKFSYPIMRHMLNSAGIVRFAQVAQMDMVRLGLGLYGIDTTGEIQGQLENVSSLKTYVSQIKMVKGQDTVGYNRAGVLRKPTKIATISIGYGDGLSRRLSNGRGKMRVNGQIAPIIGNICMDMCMLDVTHIVNVQEGDTVVVFDKERPVEVLAQQLNTIPYEVLTGITARVKRVYFQA